MSIPLKPQCNNMISMRSFHKASIFRLDPSLVERTSKQRRKNIIMRSLPLRHAPVMLIGARCYWSLARDAPAGALYVLGVGSALEQCAREARSSLTAPRSFQNEVLRCARVPPVLSHLSDVPGVGRVFMRDVSSTGRVLSLRHR